MREMIILSLFMAVSGSCNSFHGKPEFSWTYTNLLEDSRIVDLHNVEEIIELCCLTVRDHFDYGSIQVEIEPCQDFEGRMRLVDGVIHCRIFTFGSKVSVQHLQRYAHIFTHELAEWMLGLDSYHGGTLYLHDRSNRWIGEGIAEYLSTLALLRARDEGYPLMEGMHPRMSQLDHAEEKRIDAVNLGGWEIYLAGERKSSTLLVNLCYVSAECLISRWILAAGENGLDNPLKSLWLWLLNHEGPRYREITDWMEEVSGLPIAKMAKCVAISDVKKYCEDILIPDPMVRH